MADGKHEVQAADDVRPKRRRLPGVNLRPGSVKQARLEAGLSLAQLGKGHVTAPAIYLIETGRTRPSLPTLEHIARRTGKPMEYFLAEPPMAADQTISNLLALSALVAQGRNREAIELGRSLLDHGASGFRLGKIRFMVAKAYLNSSQPELAEPLLAEARAHFEAVNDRAMLAEAIGAQAVLAMQKHSKDAVQLAQEAFEICSGLTPRLTPLEARLSSVLATAHMVNRDWDSAIEAYLRAIEAGSRLTDPMIMAETYGELGFAYQQAGELEAAARYILYSIALRLLLNDRASLAQAENNLGLALMTRGDLVGARGHLDRALELSEGFDHDFGRGQVLLSLCQLATQAGDIEQAARYAGDALNEAERQKDGAAAAEAHVALGRVADQKADHATADREFEQAISRFEGLGLQERLLQTHGVYAELLERRGDLAKAYIHMKQALQASRPGSTRHHEKERVNSA